jgi:glycosyltransferase involved in cell wall biosynthesis
MPPSPDAPRLRVALVGNVANCLVPVAQALRAGGLEAHLFVADDAPQVSRPENIDPRLLDVPWIRRGPWFPAWSALVPWRAPVVAALRDYDVIVVSGTGALYAQWSGRPFCWWVSGHDLTATPFPWAFRSTYPTWRRRLGAFPLALWQRRAARRAERIWVQPFAPFREALERLRIGAPPVSSTYLPLMVEIVPRGVDATGEHALEGSPILRRMADADLVVLHPSRMLIDDSVTARRSGQWKGNDRLIRGMAELRRRRPDLDALLVLIDSSVSRDTDEARRLIDRLDMGEQVLWARPAGAESFTRPEMAALYDAADVVAVEFGSGWFGTVALEGMAMGRAVLSHVDVGPMRELYPDGHPIVSAFEPTAVADALERLLDPAVRESLGTAGRRWVEEHHTPEVIGLRYVAEVSAAAQRARRGQPPAT